MSKIRKKYTKAQKLEIVKLSLAPDQSVTELSRRYNVSANTIYNWRSKYSKYENDAFPGHGVKTQTDHEREISRLELALKEAQLERDILKKAVSIFSKSDKQFSSL